MGLTCSYCSTSLVGPGLTGRPWPDRPPARYCCYGCLSLGEQSRAGRAAGPRPPGPDGVVFRLGLALLLTGPAMALSIGIYVSPPPDLVRAVIQSAVLALSLIVVALLGGPLFRNAVAELRRGRLT